MNVGIIYYDDTKKKMRVVEFQEWERKERRYQITEARSYPALSELEWGVIRRW